MYTIKQAAARTGLSVAIVRVWERRYGIVRPGRTAAGYRLYDDESIARLLAMRRLVADEGWQPSQAARRVLEDGLGPPASTDAAPGTDSGPALAAGGGRGGHDGILVDAFVLAVRDLDVAAMERILDECFAARRFELAIEAVVSPALGAIGDAWARGEIDVAAEHAASETVRRRLARFFDAAGTGARIARVIVGLPPRGHHEIGAFAFAVAGRRAGLDLLYLGADVPVESWVRTVEETGAPVVVLGVVTAADVDAAAEVVLRLQALSRPPICLIGGPLADHAPASPLVTRLPARLDEAVGTVVALFDSSAKGLR